jgi:hypothetical protein
MAVMAERRKGTPPHRAYAAIVGVYAGGLGVAGLAARAFGRNPSCQTTLDKEIGGTPRTALGKFAERSPITYARAIADSCVPVQIWWTRTDKIVLDPARQSGSMFKALERLNPSAPVDEYVGDWDHTDAMRHETDLPKMLAGLGLLRQAFAVGRLAATHVGIPSNERCTKV